MVVLLLVGSVFLFNEEQLELAEGKGGPKGRGDRWSGDRLVPV